LKLRGVTRAWWASRWLPLGFFDELLGSRRAWEAEFPG
jgi:hypothetical protein